MDKVKRLLSFVAKSDANMLTFNLDKDGMEILVERLAFHVGEDRESQFAVQPWTSSSERCPLG